MRVALSPAMRQHLGSWAVRLVARLPQPWRATARRRRLLCLALGAPGFAAIAALPLHENLWALGSGTLAVLAAAALRALSEPALLMGDVHEQGS